MTPFEFARRFYEDELLTIAGACVKDFGLGRPDFHKRWSSEDFLLGWYDGMREGSIGWPSSVGEQVGLRPLYIGHSSGTTRNSMQMINASRSWTSKSKSQVLTSDPSWEAAESMGEVKALLLYANCLVAFDPLQDFSDADLVAQYGNAQAFSATVRNSPHLLRELSLAFRDGTQPRPSSRKQLSNAFGFARLLYWLARFEQLVETRLVEIHPRPAEARLAEVRKQVVARLDLRPLRLEQLPLREVRSRVIAEGCRGLVSTSPPSPFA